MPMGIVGRFQKTRRQWLLVLGLVLAAGCGPSREGRGPIVLELANRKMTLDELRLEYDVREKMGAFDQLPLEQKQAFLKTIGDKEVLLALSREAGPLEPPFDRFAREASDQNLLRAFENVIKSSIVRDTATTRELIARLNKQARLSWVVNPSDSIAYYARQQVVNGRPFAEVAREYSSEDSTAKIGGLLGWRSGDQMGFAFAEELFLTDREPGYLSDVHWTPRGHEFYLVHETRPFDLRTGRPPGVYETMPEFVNGIRFQQYTRAWIDSVKTARGYRVHQETLPILRVRMLAFWDSLKANGADAPRVAKEFEPPFKVFSKEELEKPAYDLDGRSVTIRELLESLRRVPMTLWPFGLDDPAIQMQVEKRCVIDWQLEQARALGLDRHPFVMAQNRMAEEKVYIDRFQKSMIEPAVGVLPAEVRQYYEQNRENYKQVDKIRLSYIVFPTQSEAEAFYAKAARSDGRWWTGRCADYIKDRPNDVVVVANSQDYDLSQPIPEEVRGMVELGRERAVTDVLRPVQVPGKGWSVGRVLYRERPGYLPFEKVEMGITRRLGEERAAAKTDSMVHAGRTKYKLQLFPERLAPAT